MHIIRSGETKHSQWCFVRVGFVVYKVAFYNLASGYEGLSIPLADIAWFVEDLKVSQITDEPAIYAPYIPE